MNRLNLDFTISSAADREVFLYKYLDEIKFKPTADELDMMAKYLLWGVEENQESAADNGNIELETRHKTWAKREDESLDALMEQPTFNEAATFVSVPTKIPRQVFSRNAALRDAPDHLIPIFESLFRQIDELDLILNYYDLEHGKRKQEPREELLDKFTFNEAAELRERASKLTQYKYLKMRHELVELRNQQYTYKDCYAPPMQRALPQHQQKAEDVEFESNLFVLPLGLALPGSFTELLFKAEEELIPENFTEEQLHAISRYYWERKEMEEARSVNLLDLRKPEQLGELLLFLEELSEQDINKSTEAMINTLKYYIDFTNLLPIHKEILELKISKHTNQQIQQIINPKYDKSYTVNYISTIFRQKIIPAIIEAINYHYDIISNLYFEEEFKRCIHCGRLMLIHPHNFVRKSRSKDGFNSKCKVCEKADRKNRG